MIESLESIVLGTIQGITEWLPISSEGAMILAKVRLFGSTEAIRELIHLALFLHFGTFLAALWYFREDVRHLLSAFFTYPVARQESKNIILFLVIATAASGAVGLGLLFLLEGIEERIAMGGKAATAFIGVLLLVTAGLQFRAKGRKSATKGVLDLRPLDGLLLGVVQGLSVLPGLSRSGLTISALLLRRFDEVQALRLSFLMSMPAILGGNILLNREEFHVSLAGILGVVFAFFFGLLTIHFLLRIARKVSFAYFTLLFGILTMLSLLI
ncbi:MAG: undecaprenyl-diphosphate phosphatase [Candidatus Yanofskybacteria bacterium]|nr:undecaprenyl-diphosphate phosphatase [Candidatus Yanofskybacteria bacterium]